VVPLANLPWLVAPPADFRQQARELRSAASACSRELARRLAGYRLDNNQLHSLGKVLPQMAAGEPDRVRLGVLANGTVDHLLPALTVSALRHGLWLDCVSTAFDQVAPEALNPQSTINRAQCHFVLLCLDYRALPLHVTPGDAQGARQTVETALQYLETLKQGIKSASGATIVFQTIPQIPDGSFGSLERSVPGTLQWLIEHINTELRARLDGSSDLLLDTAALAERVGLSNWHDLVQWAIGKFSIAHALVPLYADWVGRLLGAARGKARKCLVLDLDNTLWGGVIGDAGLGGIVLGNGSPAGEAFLSIQQAALALRNRGILLAVSSKNDDAVAREVFRSHPEMLLREQHLAVFQANWQDKASNLKAIASTLNIGLDSLVLLDDNAAERAQVRDALPMVAVPELPDDPALFAETLLAAGYFEATRFTAEDQQRAGQYQANAARAKLLESSTDLSAYLRSLSMQAVCGPFDRIGRSRITQLINKTNQFNLTTRRYTETEVEAFERSPDAFTLQMRLIDRFGDNGVIAIVICVKEGTEWVIDTWLMSCRVLNRGVEQATLNYIVSHAKLVGIRALIGRYSRTERNGMVAEHYPRLGFSPVAATGAQSEWRLEVATYVPAAVPIEIVESASEQERPAEAPVYLAHARGGA